MTNILRLRKGDSLLIATHNDAKVKEFEQLLKPFSLDILSAKTLNLPEPEETGKTFHDNAYLKAISASNLSHKISLADDSGFCINALAGNPGIFSSRLAGPTKNYAKAMQQLEDQLRTHKDKSAYFICVLCLAWPNGNYRYFEGKIEGQFVWPPRGNKGHGYDPVFQPYGSNLTFAEMFEAEKNKISHRGKALELFLAECIN